jgi:carboxypeptidase family protein
MFKTFRALCLLFVTASALACGNSANDLPVTPTIGTVATVQGTVMRANTYITLSGVVISIGGVTLRTGPDGTYAISGLKPGEALLTAEREGYQRFSEKVALEGARTFNIFLWPSDATSRTLTR